MRAAGITVVGSTVSIVVISGTRPYDCDNEREYSLQDGNRPRAYSVIYGQIKDFLEASAVDTVVIKASAVSGKGANDALLLSAELRGVVQAAAAEANCSVTLLKKATLSLLGGQKLDVLLRDNQFWNDNLPQLKKRTLREAAFFSIEGMKR